MSTAPPSATPVTRAAGLLGAASVLLIGVATLLQPVPPAAHKSILPANSATDLAPANAGRPCTPGPVGFLRGRFFGALNLTADWSGAELLCDGMRRPDGQGVRLFFAKEQPGGGRVSVLIGIDGRTEDLVGGERPANVTVIDERSGRFFSTSGPGRCWATINSVTALPRNSGGHDGHRVDGLVYCVGALPSVGDRSSLTLSDLHFAGRITADEG